jgi:hypothetical protein
MVTWFELRFELSFNGRPQSARLISRDRTKRFAMGSSNSLKAGCSVGSRHCLAGASSEPHLRLGSDKGPSYLPWGDPASRS